MNQYIQYLSGDQFATGNGIELTECKPGYARASVKINETHLNGAGVVHGGLLFTLADYAFAAATNAYGNVALSINASISYFAKSTEGIITAEAKETARSGKLIHCCVRISHEDGTLLGEFKGTAYVTREIIEF